MGGHPDPAIRGGGGGEGGSGLRNIFSAPRASVWSKNKGEARAPRAPPLDPSLNKIKYLR